MNLAIDQSREGRLKELDGWRAISVLLVIVHHFGFYHAGLLLRFPSAVTTILHFCGLLGVRTFFVISGFVICRLLISEEKRYGSVSLKGFYYRRIFRILPPFFLYLAAISLLLTLRLVHENWKSILGAGLFLFDTSLTSHSWFVGHTWSLAAEEQFYLIFPITWILAPKRWRSSLCLAVFFLLAGWNFLAFFTHWNMFVGTNGRVGFSCIAWGVLMAINEHRARQVVRRVPISLVALVAIGLLVHPVFSESWHRVLYECLMVPPAIAGVVLQPGVWTAAQGFVVQQAFPGYRCYFLRHLLMAATLHCAERVLCRAGCGHFISAAAALPHRAAVVFLRREAGNALWQVPLASSTLSAELAH